MLSIFQDDDGFMWFGTYDGLNFYDGKSVYVYRSDPSAPTNKTLLNNIIEELSPAEQGAMWVSTSTGINKFSLKQRKVVESFDHFGLPFNLNSNRKGDAWVLVKDTLYYYNTFHHQFLGISAIDVRHKWEHSFVDQSGILWVFPTGQPMVCQYRMNAFDKQNPNEAKVTVSTLQFHSKKIVYTCYQNGLLAFIDQDGDLFLYDQSHHTKVYIRNLIQLSQKYGPVEGIVSFNGDILIAFRENGLVKLEAALRYEATIVDPNIRIFTLYKDPVQDIVWIGTDGQGTIQYSKNYSLATNVLLERLSGNLTRPVRCMLTDKRGNLWFGTKGDGLVRIEAYQQANTTNSLPEHTSVYFPGEKKSARNYTRSLSEFQLFELKESRYMDGFWMGTADAPGLLYYDYQADRVVPMLPRNPLLQKVHTIHEESDSVLWLATSGSGLCRVALHRSQAPVAIDTVRQFLFYKNRKVLNDFYSMVAEGDSLLWLGSRGMGLVKFNTKTEAYRVYSLDEEIKKKSVNDILSIYQEGDVLYLGTVSGLVRLAFSNQRQSFTTTVISKEEGLLNDMIHGILKDKNGFFWLSTNKGLVKYNPANGSMHSYYYSNGIEVGEFSDDAYYTCPYTGDLFFGGINGLLRLEKERVAESEYYPNVHFQNLKMGQQEVSFSDYYSEESGRLVLHGASVTFSLSFVAPDFIRGADFEYSYLLEGSDDEAWSRFSSENVATFSKLPYGTYTLKVRYKKDVFDTEYQSYTLPIVVLPPWYLTWQAYLLYALLLTAATLYLLRIVRNHYRRERMIKELMAHERLNQSEVQRIRYRETMDAFSIIYTVSGQLKQLHGAAPASDERLNVIHETALEMALRMGMGDSDKWPLDSFNLADFAIYGQVNIRELSDEVLSFFSFRAKADAPPCLQLDIPAGLSFMLYKNALRHVLYYLYHWSGSQPLTITFATTDEQLDLAVVATDGSLGELLRALTEGDPTSAVGSKGTTDLFFAHLLELLCRHALEHLHASVGGDARQITFSFPLLTPEPLEEVEAVASKETLLLLENKGEMVWLIRQQLAADYEIEHVRTIQEAFNYLKKQTPALFIVDTLMYLNEESKLLEYVQTHRALLVKTAFIPLMTWKSVSLMHDVLERLSDAYVIMPYDALFLRSIARRAVREKQNLKLVIVEGLGDAGSEIVCSTVAQADFIKKIIRIIDENLDREDLGSTFIAEQMAVSSRQFYRKFKEVSGSSPSDFIKNYRIEKAAKLLTTTSLSIQEVINDVGISSRSYFYKEFMRKYGQTPKDYRELLHQAVEE